MSQVSLHSIAKGFGAVPVVEGIDFQIQDGEFVSFLGPSGCGKTTILRMIAGFEQPSSGEIRIGDRVVSSVQSGVFLPPEERNIGMVFQNYAVWPHMNVFENVAYPLKTRKVPAGSIRERVMAALSMTRLGDLARRYPHQLSGGQQQRVALARALVMEPDVMLLDEPLSNLDAKLREEMRFEIKDIQRRIGATIVYVTHDQAEAMAMSDRIVLLHDRSIQQIGTPRELYERPANRFVADFIGLINFLEADVVSETRRDESVMGLLRLAGAEGVTFEARLPRSGISRPVVAVRPENIRLLSPGSGFPGRVLKRVYLGEGLDYRVNVGGMELRVKSAPDVAFDEGDSVGVAFDRFVIFAS